MTFSEDETSRIIEMAWEDRTPFEAIEAQFQLTEAETIKFMRVNLKRSAFKLWRKRVSSRVTKHLKLRHFEVGRGYCSSQYKHRNS